jgi:hypothetical protein
MRRIFKLFIITLIVIPLALVAIKAYASGGVEVAIIDTEECINCGACYAAQRMWVVDDPGDGYPHWVHAEGGFQGLLYYWSPTESHKEVIELDLIGACPMRVFSINW